jgi:transcriptional regulator with XRE-family HTH domain
MQVEGNWRALPHEYRALGRAVREVRARRGFSQEALGFRADLHRNYVGAIERGQINPSFRTLLRVTRGLDMPLSDLIALYERNLGEPGVPTGRIGPWT